MTDELKEKIQPIYKELQGYLSQTPLPKEINDVITNSMMPEQFNNTIDELNNLSGKNYDKFKIFPDLEEPGYKPYSLMTYRQKIGGLIFKLHAEYFPKDNEPFSGTPKTIITQNQLQNQSLHIQMLLDFQSLIDRRIPELNEGSKGKNFLEKMKESLHSVSSTIDLVNLILKTAGTVGLTLAELTKIISP